MPHSTWSVWRRDATYLRDSLGELSQHQLENEAHEAVRRHARQVAEQTGVPARELVEGTRVVRRQQQMTQFFNLHTKGFAE